MADSAADIYFPKNLTLEHVLPRKPAVGSQWLKDFSFEQRQTMTNLLGNLALLTEKLNPQASNSDWPYKKKIIFGCRSNQSFPITTNLSQHDVWTPVVIERRHRELLSLFDQIISV
ncbi:MAG: HNH endonuclease family protein [Hyphomicrobiales bacterium]|nr:HNH endonuclease family protein [Hyphomicrobiales bacterium]